MKWLEGKLVGMYSIRVMGDIVSVVVTKIWENRLEQRPQESQKRGDNI